MSQIDIRFFSRSLNRHTSFKMYIPDDKRNYGGVYDKQNMKTLFILHGYTQDGNNWIPEYISEKYNYELNNEEIMYLAIHINKIVHGEEK